MISFIIIFHPERIENLKQTIRFLEINEGTLHELILVCQTNFPDIKSNFIKKKQINLNLNSYNKPEMTNAGVFSSTNEIIALIDSDRILTKGYFNYHSNEIKEKTIISTWNMWKLDKHYSDAEINSKKTKEFPDFKSETNIPRTKNLFSGNTLMLKKDFISIGGYDTQYKGYGYADTDMTQKVASENFKSSWNKCKELHLFHEPTIYHNCQTLNLELLQIMTLINGLKYHKKWKIPLDKKINELIKCVENKIEKFPLDLNQEYKRLKEITIKINFSKRFI